MLVRLVKEKPLGTVGGVIILILFLTGIFANWIAPYGYNEMTSAARLSPPSQHFLLGTDHLGRDILSRIIYGARISVIIGVVGSTIAVIVSLAIALTSGYFGGKVDAAIQRFVDAWMCMPSLFILLTVMSILGPGLIQILIVVGPFFGITQSRIIRSAVIGVKENMYVDAARAVGAPASRIIFRHIFPNVFSTVIVLFTVNMGAVILTESTLSFLGFGIPPPTPAWGSMISESGARFLLLAPGMAFWPGMALSIVVYGVNMLGDGLRDVLDPRLRGGLGRFGGVEKKRAKRREKAEKAQGSV
ncbi:MAG: ABC transporter permease [Chloroflexi bacterium]|nr:ABC transporter permease [Chloroflexota bacterium]